MYFSEMASVESHDTSWLDECTLQQQIGSIRQAYRRAWSEPTLASASASNVSLLYVSKTVLCKGKVVYRTFQRLDIDSEWAGPSNDDAKISAMTAAELDR